MLVSIPIITKVVDTNVTDDTQIYDSSKTYEDKELVLYDPTGGLNYDIYGVFTDSKVTPAAPHHSFVYYSKATPYKPIDGKMYSKATKDGLMTYTVIGEGSFDTLALGGILGDSVTAIFKDPKGHVLFSVIDHKIDNNIDIKGRHKHKAVTEVIYSTVDMPHGSTVEITIKSSDVVELGIVLLALSVDAGFTHLAFTNKFKDYSPTETDQWGNVVYKEGLKVNVHTGTVDIPIGNYDYMNRTMLAIGGKTVIINGYGEKFNDEPTQAKGHFYGTMMIGRMKNFTLNTNVIDKRMSEYATYKIEVEEIV